MSAALSEGREQIWDVAVIGGGMVGVAAAWHCRARGLSVALLDPGDPKAAASYGNAGVISRGSLLPVGTPAVWPKLLTYALNRDPAVRIEPKALPSLLPWITHLLRTSNAAHVRRAAAALDTLCAPAYDEHWSVAAEIGASHLIQRKGWLKVYRTEAAFAGTALERELLTSHGVAHTVLDGHEIRQAEPALKRAYAKALWITETGSVSSPGDLVARWTTAVEERGVRRIAVTVSAVRPGPDGVHVETSSGSVHARHVVIAAGAASADLLRPLGVRIPFAAERGYHRHFTPTGPHALNRPVYDTGAGFVMAPMADGVRVTSGIELNRRDAPPNPAQIAAAEREARTLLDLGAAVEEQAWVGSRPSSPDGLPIIGRCPGHPAVVLAFGHGHVGLTMGPITGRLVADLVTGTPPAVPIAPFAAERYL